MKAMSCISVGQSLPTSPLIHLESRLLGLRTDIKSYIGDPQCISASCVLKLIDENELSIFENMTAILNWTRIMRQFYGRI
jgi:hypothetical protein